MYTVQLKFFSNQGVGTCCVRRLQAAGWRGVSAALQLQLRLVSARDSKLTRASACLRVANILQLRAGALAATWWTYDSNKFSEASSSNRSTCQALLGSELTQQLDGCSN